MTIFIFSLLLLVFGGSILALNTMEDKSHRRNSTVLTLSKNTSSWLKDKNETFSLASLILFVFYPPQEVSSNLTSRN